MAGLIGRLEAIAGERQPLVEQAKANLSDAKANRTGAVTSSLAGDLRLLAVAAFALAGDVEKFRLLLRESALLRESLFDRFDAGEPVDESYVSMIAYKNLFDSLACADIDLARRFAAKLGGRLGIEKRHDHKFIRAIGYALKYVVLAPNDHAADAVATFWQECNAKGNSSYAGYAQCMKAVLDAEAASFHQGLEALLRNHKALCSRGRMFDLTPDEIICTWGLGLTNLAAARGLQVKVDHVYIPRALVNEWR
jgi:hypothetical protein